MCSRCHLDQPRSEFGPSADLWPERRVCHPCSRHLSQRKRHGLSKAERSEIADVQGGCLICARPEPGAKGWVVDHDRSCCSGDTSCPKCRRGVVCQWCNSVLGYAFDQQRILRSAADYLDRFAVRSDETLCGWHMPIACAPGICGKHSTPHIHERNGRNGRTNADASNFGGDMALSDAREETP